MSDEDVQLQVQRNLKAFDDAKAESVSTFRELGRDAIKELQTFIDHWKSKPFMKPQNVDLTSGGHDDLRQDAENQIKWAEGELARVKSELALVDDSE